MLTFFRKTQLVKCAVGQILWLTYAVKFANYTCCRPSVASIFRKVFLKGHNRFWWWPWIPGQQIKGRQQEWQNRDSRDRLHRSVRLRVTIIYITDGAGEHLVAVTWQRGRQYFVKIQQHTHTKLHCPLQTCLLSSAPTHINRSLH